MPEPDHQYSPPAPKPGDGRDSVGSSSLLLIALLALAIRCIYLLEIRRVGFFSGLLSDSAVYFKRAAQIAHGDWLGPADFVHAPTYAYLLALLQIIGLTDLLSPRLVQIVLGTASCLLIVQIADRLFDRRVALLAGLLYAVCPAAIFFDGQIQKTSLAAFLAILLLWQLTAIQRPSTWRAAACGLTTGLLVLTQQSTLILIPLLPAWLIVDSRVSSHQSSITAAPIRNSAIFLLALTLTFLPWTLRNRAVTGHLTLTTPNLGQNFFMGNSRDATGTYLPQFRGRSTGEFEQEEWTRTAARALGHAPTLAEVSDYYLHLALDFIRDHPLAWLRLTAKKVLMTWNAYEAGDTEDYYLYVEHSALLAALDAFLNFGILAPLAAAGVALTWRHRRRLWPLYAWAALTTIATAAFVVFARYRFPLIPIVVIFAAAAIVSAADSLRSHHPRRLLAPALVAACAALLTNWPVHLHRRTQPYSYVNHATALAQQSRFDEALTELDKALALDPADMSALITRGSTLIDMDRSDDALAVLHRAETIYPGDHDVFLSLVAANLAAGRFNDAAAYARRVLADDGDDVRAKTGLATALARSGQTRQAIEMFNEVIQRRPDQVDAYVNLGATYITEGRPDDAQRCWQTALSLSPDNLDALQNLANLELSRGHSTRAVELLEQLLRIAPNRPGARSDYEAALRASQSPQTSRPRP